jgi:ATP-dependent helicase/nuclease subunit A
MTRITEFFASDIGRRVVSAARRGVLKREKPFTLRTARDGRRMLVQGVIDCCFEEDGEMVLIDYKTSWIRPGRPHEEEIVRIKDEYKVQMQLYSEAIRKGTGMDVAEAYLYLFTISKAIEML